MLFLLAVAPVFAKPIRNKNAAVRSDAKILTTLADTGEKSEEGSKDSLYSNTQTALVGTPHFAADVGGSSYDLRERRSIDQAHDGRGPPTLF